MTGNQDTVSSGARQGGKEGFSPTRRASGASKRAKKDEGKSGQLVTALSEGYGYRYASLADIVKSGFVLPEMRVRNINGRDYVEYKDKDGEWNLGAAVISEGIKGLANSAQAYGAALTYARRYTALLALGLASTDDESVETVEPASSAINREYEEILADCDNQKALLFMFKQPLPFTLTAEQEAKFRAVYRKYYKELQGKEDER